MKLFGKPPIHLVLAQALDEPIDKTVGADHLARLLGDFIHQAREFVWAVVVTGCPSPNTHFVLFVRRCSDNAIVVYVSKAYENLYATSGNEIGLHVLRTCTKLSFTDMDALQHWAAVYHPGCFVLTADGLTLHHRPWPRKQEEVCPTM